MVEIAEAVAHYKSGRLDESERALRRTLARDATAHEAWYYLGLIAYSRSDPASAYSAFEHAVALEPANANANFYLGEICAGSGDTVEAKRRFALAVATNPEHQSALARLAQLASLVASAPVVEDVDLWPGEAQFVDHARRDERKPAAVEPTFPREENEPLADERTFPPEAPRSRDSVIGIVEGFQQRLEPYGSSPMAMVVWTFRLQTYDVEGRRGRIAQVDFRGPGLKGSVCNGDWVEIDRRWQDRRGRGLRPKEIRNLTTGDVARARRFKL
jgi:tetratricopeptide (TPR) repeat protein